MSYALSWVGSLPCVAPGRDGVEAHATIVLHSQKRERFQKTSSVMNLHTFLQHAHSSVYTTATCFSYVCTYVRILGIDAYTHARHCMDWYVLCLKGMKDFQSCSHYACTTK